MKERIYAVSEFNRMVKETLEDIELFREFFLEGELSGITYYKSGHLYFSIKDSKTQIRCVAFNYRLKKIPKDLEEGECVKIFGDIGFYETRGEFQILVRHIERQDRLGVMFANLEKLKAKLEKEGLFSAFYKKPLPKYPQKIGVVTAFTGAGFQDIISTTRKRYENIDIYIYPAKVQGVGAKEEIAEGIEVLNRINDLDFIIVGRGGGSIEDLWCFNEELVARAIFKSKIPIISAVGHEIDILLSDLVADVRASTPTQAIEIGVPVKKEIEQKLIEKRERLNRLIKNIIEEKKNSLKKLEASYSLRCFSKLLDEKNIDIIDRKQKLYSNIKNILERKRYNIELKIEKILSLNPISTLKRGYSITKFDNKILKNSKNVKKDDIIETILDDGKIISIVKEIKNQ